MGGIGGILGFTPKNHPRKEERLRGYFRWLKRCRIRDNVGNRV